MVMAGWPRLPCHAAFSCPEQDNKLLERVFRPRRARAHGDAMPSRKTQRARTCHGWLAAPAVTMRRSLVLSTDNKLFRRVRRGQGMCAYCDAVTNQNTKPTV